MDGETKKKLVDEIMSQGAPVMLIASETQAHRVGQRRTGSPKGYRVFWYIHPQSCLTLFCVELKKTRELITFE